METGAHAPVGKTSFVDQFPLEIGHRYDAIKTSGFPNTQVRDVQSPYSCRWEEGPPLPLVDLWNGFVGLFARLRAAWCWTAPKEGVRTLNVTSNHQALVVCLTAGGRLPLPQEDTDTRSCMRNNKAIRTTLKPLTMTGANTRAGVLTTKHLAADFPVVRGAFQLHGQTHFREMYFTPVREISTQQPVECFYQHRVKSVRKCRGARRYV